MARNERSAGFICFRRRPGADPSAGGVEYLLLDYGRHWEYAKGHVDRGEGDLDAAVRELREETGIVDPRIVEGFRHELVYFFRDRGKGLIRKTVIFFLAETGATDGDVVLSDEHVGFAFLPYDAALKRVTFAGARQVLRAAHDHLTGKSTSSTSEPISTSSTTSPSDAASLVEDDVTPPSNVTGDRSA